MAKFSASVQFRMNSLARINNRLLPGSELLRTTHWKRVTELELKSLVSRFATREQRCQITATAAFYWRKRRLAAVAVYEARFGKVPDIFRRHTLVRLKSYYVNNGKYVWSGKAVWGTT